MPLPPDGTISLLGSSRPGETSHSRPKQAMIIRMSEKTLDLLESFPQLHFEFSDSPGVYIGDTFFPVTSVPETSPHDLYLRTSSTTKRNAPLKLCANVTGKFTVERQLDDRITGKVRASTVDAQKERAGRTTIFVETPSNLPPPNSKKRKEPAMFMKKTARPSDQPNPSAPSSSTVAPPRTASPAPSLTQRSKEALQALRMRMIRCIAVAERTSDQVVKLVGGHDCSASAKRDILDLLEEIAEPIPLPNNSKAPKIYRLKTKSWLDVRPYELSGLKESERTNIARAAKLALRDLKIPESDPAWSHVQYRNPSGVTPPATVTRKQPTNGVGSSKSGQASEAPKRGITSTAAKEKKAKARNDSGEIMMKNESLKVSTQRPSAVNTSRDEDPTRAIPPIKPPASRPRPGSGFKAKQPTPTESRDFANGRSPLANGKPTAAEPSGLQDKDLSSSTSRRPPPTSSQPPERKPPSAASQKIEKLRGGEFAGSDSERSDRTKGRDREKVHRNREKERDGRERERREKERERDRRDLEKERGRERARRREAELESDKERERGRRIKETGREREWSQEREEGEHSEDSLRMPKRKKTAREDDDYDDPSSRAAQKRRKIDSPPPRDTKVKDLAPPRRPEVDLPPRPKMIKEPSPLPPLPKIKKEPTPIPKLSAPPNKASPSASSQVSSSKTKTGNKLRRKSPIYTSSSSDEGEIRPPPAPAPAPPSNNIRHKESQPQSRSHTSKSLPTDHAALRARYNASYLDYVDTFQKLMREKTKINNVLSKNMDKMSAGSITDSDGDGELLDPEELKRLTLDYNRLHDELGGIRRILSGNGRTGSVSE